MIALREGESGPLAWSNLIRESIGIVVFISVWYLLGWAIAGFGVGFASNGGAGAILVGAIIGSLGVVMVVASTFIVLLRVLGKAIAFGLEEAHNRSVFVDPTSMSDDHTQTGAPQQ
ncbi:hypothetical protein [Halobellus rufus]|uniref:hypothetical protein n=1 Tax=Halobellus rufus TaxID=1448860 RepID=UPI000678B819|nr:hypothetical protein [Halobellus rufus]